MGTTREQICGPFTIHSGFDSGNCLKAEFVPNNPSSFTAGPSFKYEYELNIWTKPDCHGTAYENGNRTWFYFGVQGGVGGSTLKLNVVNLNKQIKLFVQGMQPVFRVLPHKPTWERVKDRLIINETNQHVCSISFRHKLPDDPDNSIVYFAFTYPYPLVEMGDWLNAIEKVHCQCTDEEPEKDRSSSFSHLSAAASSGENRIYFHRECVCQSLEGRRVELLTVSSHFGISKDREDRLFNLFPILDQPRPFKFPNKKVIFLSARVHPGETPSSFVINGFLKFIMEKNDPRAVILRRFFVFKFMPMLNPDGVASGHYRTDPRGVNLNRVYLAPSPTVHPSIYAARKLLLYYHYGYDTPDDYDYEELPSMINSEVLEKPEEKEELNANASEVYTFVLNESNSLCAGCCDVPPESSTEPGQEGSEEVKDHQCAFEACDEDSIVFTSDIKTSSNSSSTHSQIHKVSQVLLDQEHVSRHLLSEERISPPTKKRVKSKQTNEDATERRRSFSLPPQNRSRSSSFPFKGEALAKSTSRIQESNSGLFLYVDMHGHATKRGIFMYGNHFSDANAQVECMLLPRLMAMNCPHFDFSACNFTERLMSMKDRRDGASREGSGRVACLKLTGLVRSYTLECNYNTGRLVNHLVTRPPLLGLTDPKTQHSPGAVAPKFTPTIFEEAGKALGDSILDLTGLNPWSRLGHSDYRNLEGLKRSLLTRIKPEYKYFSLSPKESLKGLNSPHKSATSTLNSALPLKSTKSKKKAGSAKLTLPQSGPLGLRRENQNRTPSVDPGKPSGSKVKPTMTASTSVKAKAQSSATVLEKKRGKVKPTTEPDTPPKRTIRKKVKKSSLINTNSSDGL